MWLLNIMAAIISNIDSLLSQIVIIFLYHTLIDLNKNIFFHNNIHVHLKILSYLYKKNICDMQNAYQTCFSFYYHNNI